MASALLASRNEPYWGERKVYMRKNPNSNPRPNPNPNPSNPIFDPSDRIHARGTEESTAVVATPAAVSDSSSSLNRPEYVSYNIAGCSRRDLQDLKNRLLAELDRVRALTRRIEREFQSRSGYSASNFSPAAAACGGTREVNSTNSSMPRPQATSGVKRPPPPPAVVPSKRPLVAATTSDSVSGKARLGMMKRCGQILGKLMNHKPHWVFNSPVDVVALGLHDYYQIIKNPMDLGTVKSKLKKNLYQTPLDFAADVRLTFNNAMVYNPKGHDVHIMAERLLARFEEMFSPAYRKCEAELRMAETEEMRRRNSWSQTPASTPPPLPQPVVPVPPPSVKTMPTPAPVSIPSQALVPITPSLGKPLGMRSTMAKQPKPKAKDPNKREMSFEEKQKLSLSLQELPQEKMDQVVQIIRRRNSNLAQHGDEIEVDIEVVDTETLWELDRFVCNCKKMMSKMKRQALANNNQIAGTSAAADGNKSPVGEIPDTIAAKKNSKKGEMGEEDVDIGEEMPSTNFPPVEIEKDATGYASGSSSSSSSSSDSSSSSGSDSGSSSDSDSDADDAQSPFTGVKPASPKT